MPTFAKRDVCERFVMQQSRVNWRFSLGGAPNIYQTNAEKLLVRIAALHGHLPMLEWLLKNDKSFEAMVKYSQNRYALICQHPEVVHWILNRSHQVGILIWMNKAVTEGNMEFIKWNDTHEEEYPKAFGSESISKAAGAGHLEFLKYLHMIEFECLSAMAMHNAAAAGHLELLQWLEATSLKYSNSDVVFNSPRLEAARNGHLHPIKWLLEESQLFLSDESERLCWYTEAMNGAIEAGDCAMLKYLFEHRPFACTTRGLTRAIARGDLEMVEWLHARGFKSVKDLMKEAAEYGHLAILQWLYETLLEHGKDEAVVDAAAQNNHLHIVFILIV